MKKYLFKRDTLLATFMVFIIMGLLSFIPLNTHVLDPIKLALQDFDYNDLAYSRMGKNSQAPVDTNIIIINIDTAKRKDIAAIIQKVKSRQPLIIGVDVFFEKQKTPADDSLLINLVSFSSNLVMAYQLQTKGKKISPNGFLFSKSMHKGFTNFVGEEGGVIRHFAPVIKEKNESFESFSTAMIKVINPAKYKTLLGRGKKTESIHFTRTSNKYIIIDGKSFLAGTDSSSLNNKIVLIGYIGKSTDTEDKHFTPMNPQSFGKSLPDMNGVLVNANIIHMVLKDKYVNKMPVWLTWILAFFICWIHMSIFLAYFIERHLWFHLAAKVAQVLSAVLFVYIGLLVFYKFNYKVNLTPSFIAIILAVDVLYFYEAFRNWLNKKYGFNSVFHKH